MILGVSNNPTYHLIFFWKIKLRITLSILTYWMHCRFKNKLTERYSNNMNHVLCFTTENIKLSLDMPLLGNEGGISCVPFRSMCLMAKEEVEVVEMHNSSHTRKPILWLHYFWLYLSIILYYIPTICDHISLIYTRINV